MSDVTEIELQAGRGYEALFVPALFAPWTSRVVAAGGVKTGAHVLDVACGSGVLARAAFSKTGRSGRVVGLDPAPGMIAAANEVEAGIEWVLGSAETLPFEDNAFDCVLSQFGMMFFEDREAAAREMYRVTKPGGTLSVAIWNAIDQNPAYEDIVSVLDAQVSKAAGDAVRIPFSLGDPSAVTGFFRDAGFAGISCETHIQQAVFPSTRTMIEVELRGWLPLFGIHLDEEKIADVLEQSDLTLAKYANRSGEASFPTSAYVLRAHKPGQS